MTYIAAIATYLPPWGASTGTSRARVTGGDEDAVTMAVEAGRAAIQQQAEVRRVVLVTRDLPLLEGGNGAVLLAGLGLDERVEVTELLGGAPAVLDALTSAAPGTLVI